MSFRLKVAQSLSEHSHHREPRTPCAVAKAVLTSPYTAAKMVWMIARVELMMAVMMSAMDWKRLPTADARVMMLEKYVYFSNVDGVKASSLQQSRLFCLMTSRARVLLIPSPKLNAFSYNVPKASDVLGQSGRRLHLPLAFQS